MIVSVSSVASLGGVFVEHKRLRVWLNWHRHIDPFYIKEEFAPSEKHMVKKKQQAAHDLIAPHLRILQFLTSHFNANRLGNPHIQRIFHRLIVVSLEALTSSAGHPLAREMHFRIVLFGLSIFRYCTGLDQAARWRLKDAVLSAALAWFACPPRYVEGYHFQKKPY